MAPVQELNSCSLDLSPLNWFTIIELTSSLSLMKLTRYSPSLKHPNKTLTCKHPNDANDTIDANHLSTRHVCKLRPEQVNDNVVTSQAMTQFRESQSETTSHHKNSTSEIEETQQMQLTQLTDWLIEGKMLACFLWDITSATGNMHCHVTWGCIIILTWCV